jgi:tRNA G46 methylase TrmB
MSQEFIDEHFVPTHGLDLKPYLEQGDLNAVHHLIRYQWALECIADLPSVTSVLNLGCGAGYGSYAVAERFPNIQVLGVD